MKLYMVIKKIRTHWKYSLILLLAVVLTQCISFGTITHPGTVHAGDALIVKLPVKVNAAQQGNTNARLVIGILAPISWHLGNNATLTYTSDRSGDANGTMSVIPAGITPTDIPLPWPAAMFSLAGYGANRLKQMEWVAFWTDKPYDILKGEKITANVNIRIKTGNQNVKVQLNYFVASSALNVLGSFQPRWDTSSAVVETTGGQGITENYLDPQLSEVTPSHFVDNDIISIKFDGSLVPTALTGEDKAFLCATAYTHDQKVITVCSQDAKTEMKPVSEDVWKIALWPRKFFNLSVGQSIDSLRYSFTNQIGDKSVTSPSFMRVFSCK